MRSPTSTSRTSPSLLYPSYILTLLYLQNAILLLQALPTRSLMTSFHPPPSFFRPSNYRHPYSSSRGRRPSAMAIPRLHMSMNISRRKLLGGIAGAVVTIPLMAEAYSRVGEFRTKLPNEQFEEPEMGWENIEEVTIVFHGAGGQDQYTDTLMSNLAKRPTQPKTYNAIIDWSQFSQNLLQASFNGQRIGRQTASQLLSKVSSKSFQRIHVIGVSVGAFAADACVTELKEQLEKKGRKKESVYAQLTLLDPFTQRGALAPFYGLRMFGRKADYAQQFMNTDDPVPSTNSPCSKCAVTDVTNIRPPEIFGHDWPLVYYGKSNKLDFVPPSGRRPRGDIITALK